MKYLDPGKGDFYKLIYSAEIAKMQQNPQVRAILIETGD